jgi:hypothetical protein
MSDRLKLRSSNFAPAMAAAVYRPSSVSLPSAWMSESLTTAKAFRPSC